MRVFHEVWAMSGENTTATTEAVDWAEKIGKPAFESIAEMVAALQCDYERLEELRDERDGYEFDEDANGAPDGPGHKNSREAWAAENPDEAEELRGLEEAAGECGDQGEARERIEEDALSVQVRCGWVTPGEGMSAEEFSILLSTGGPAVRIVGELDAGLEPSRAWLEVQDWGKPWTQYFRADEDTLLAYCRCFYFGG